MSAEQVGTRVACASSTSRTPCSTSTPFISMMKLHTTLYEVGEKTSPWLTKYLQTTVPHTNARARCATLRNELADKLFVIACGDRLVGKVPEMTDQYLHIGNLCTHVGKRPARMARHDRDLVCSVGDIGGLRHSHLGLRRIAVTDGADI